VVIDCPNIPESGAESALFGHVKGAFPGADSDRPSPFELAEGGTVYIDKIGDLPINLQGKLLRVLQEHSVVRFGANDPIAVDVRIIASTQRDLESMCERGSFREDLYFRLDECRIEVPPLRERGADLRGLADHFLATVDEHRRFADDAYAAMEAYGWPGNVRELRTLVRRAAKLHVNGELIGAHELFGHRRSKTSDGPQLLAFLDLPWDQAKDEFARWYWTGVWQRYRGNRQQIAKHTDVSHVWLRSRRKLYELGEFAGD
jgi:DNA-binding NtrC family response regulator